MWRLVVANGQTPGRATYFPIYDERNDGDFKIKTAGSERRRSEGHCQRAAVRRTSQPGVKHHALFLIHELNRLDKHRTLTVVTRAVSEVEHYGEPEAVGTVARHTLQPLHDGAEVCRFILKEPLPHVDWQSKVNTTQTFIMETETTPYLNFPDVLALMHGAVVSVVDLLRSHAAD
jgi:hypothetical protein